MIRAIVFDFGNVIYSFDNNIFLEAVSHYTDKTPSELNELIYLSSDLPRQYETGLISSDQFFHKVTSQCNLSISKPEFILAYTQIFSPIQTTIKIIKQLKKQYKIGLISNTSEWDFEHIIKTSEVYHLFDALSLSFQIGVMKPDIIIFKDILHKLAVEAEECVFIDDIENYAKAAITAGMIGIHYKSFSDLIHSLEGLNII